jgi:hypothetical protein
MKSRLRIAFGAVVVVGGCSSFSSAGGGNPSSDAGADAIASQAADAAPNARCAIARVDGPAPVPTEDVLCGSVMTSLRTNARHCGACDHGCATGTCRDGLCDPELLFDGNKPEFQDSGIEGALSIRGMNQDFFILQTFAGSASQALYASLRAQPSNLVPLAPPNASVVVLRDGIVWYTGNGALRRVKTDGGDGRQLIACGDLPFAVTDKEVFVADPTGVLRTSRETAGMARPFRNETNTAEIVTDDAFTTFLTRDADGGSLVRVRLSDEAVQRTSVHRASGLTADAAYLYVYDEITSELLRFDKERLDQVDVVARIDAEGHNVVRTMLVDERYIYVALALDRSSLNVWIVRVARCGGPPLLVAKTIAVEPFRLENGALYWADVYRQAWRLPP